MLRPNPIASDPLVLTVDIGTINSAWCLFCRSSQTILYWQMHKLVDQHSPQIRDTSEVKRHLDAVMQAPQPHLPGRKFQVLVEDQVLKGKSDKDIAKNGMYFNVQLQQCVSMYFLCQGCKVQTVDASLRYIFMGITTSKMSRHQKKQAVVGKLRSLLTQGAGNDFALQPHDLSAWSHAGKRDDLADALGMALQASYRNLTAVKEKHIVTSTNNTSNQQDRPKRRKQTAKQQAPAAALAGTKEEVHATLQALLTHMEMEHHALVRRHSDDASKIAAVFAAHPHDKRLKKFMQLLNALNQLGINASNTTQLASRLARLA